MSGLSIHKGRTTSPCFTCDGHNETCHSTCEQYKEYEIKHQQERADINKKRREYSLGYGATFRTERQFKNDISRGQKAHTHHKTY